MVLKSDFLNQRLLVETADGKVHSVLLSEIEYTEKASKNRNVVETGDDLDSESESGESEMWAEDGMQLEEESH